MVSGAVQDIADAPAKRRQAAGQIELDHLSRQGDLLGKMLQGVDEANKRVEARNQKEDEKTFNSQIGGMLSSVRAAAFSGTPYYEVERRALEGLPESVRALVGTRLADAYSAAMSDKQDQAFKREQLRIQRAGVGAQAAESNERRRLARERHNAEMRLLDPTYGVKNPVTVDSIKRMGNDIAVRSQALNFNDYKDQDATEILQNKRGMPGSRFLGVGGTASSGSSELARGFAAANVWAKENGYAALPKEAIAMAADQGVGNPNFFGTGESEDWFKKIVVQHTENERAQVTYQNALEAARRDPTAEMIYNSEYALNPEKVQAENAAAAAEQIRRGASQRPANLQWQPVKEW